MLLEGKKILIMGIRNKWSIAFGIAKSAYENGAQLLFTYMGEENKEKIEELVSEFKGSKAYVLNGASEDEKVRVTFTKIKEENGKIDGIVHAIAHANTEDLHNDFIYTSKEGFAHACDVSAYSFVLIARMAKELDMLNENASLITLTYHGSTKVLEGYNVSKLPTTKGYQLILTTVASLLYLVPIAFFIIKIESTVPLLTGKNVPPLVLEINIVCEVIVLLSIKTDAMSV